MLSTATRSPNTFRSPEVSIAKDMEAKGYRGQAAGNRLLSIAMDGLERKRRQTNGDVLGASGFRRAVPNPLACVRHDGLTGADVERAAFVLDAQQAAKHDRNLFELRTLSRLGPPFRRHHPRDADMRVTRVHAS